MRRRTLRQTLTLSLVACLPIVALWALSYLSPYVQTDPVTGYSRHPPRHPLQLPIPSDAEEYVVLSRGDIERWEYTPWDKKWYRLASGVSLLSIFLPMFVLIALTLGGLAFLAEPTRHATSQRGRCLSCGYNLTGNLSGTCPECGTPVPAKATRVA